MYWLSVFFCSQSGAYNYSLMVGSDWISYKKYKFDLQVKFNLIFFMLSKLNFEIDKFRKCF